MTRAPAGTEGVRIQPVLVGYGHSGRNFHAPGIRKASQILARQWNIEVRRPILVDPAFATAHPVLPAPPTDTIAVVHVATPPERHLDVIVQALALGHRHILTEKPAVVGRRQVAQLRAALADNDAKLLVIANWLVSHLTEVLRHLVQMLEGAGRLEHVHISQSKPRFSRAATGGDGRMSAFEIEMPHMIAVACDLLGTGLRVEQASCTPLAGPGERVTPWLGASTVHLRTPEGLPVSVRSDLGAPSRERFIELSLNNGERVRGYYPCDSSDHHSQLHRLRPEDGAWEVEAVLEDDTFVRMIAQAYAYFAGCAPQPRFNVDIGLRTSQLLAEARDLAGIDQTEPQEDLSRE
jgi:predicted dehydrogenase